MASLQIQENWATFEMEKGSSRDELWSVFITACEFVCLGYGNVADKLVVLLCLPLVESLMDHLCIVPSGFMVPRG